jgi:hypothetical protein
MLDMPVIGNWAQLPITNNQLLSQPKRGSRHIVAQATDILPHISLAPKNSGD